MLGLLFLGGLGYALVKLLDGTDHVDIDTTNERVVSIAGGDLEVHNNGPKKPWSLFPEVKGATVSRDSGRVWFDDGDRSGRFWSVGSSDSEESSDSGSGGGFLDGLTTSVSRGFGYKEEEHTRWW